MASMDTITVRYELANLKDTLCLMRAYEAVSQIAYEQPWNEEAKSAKGDLKRVIRGLVPMSERGK